MPVIMLCCAVGSFAIGNNMFGVVTVATFGIIGYVMEENGYPVAAMVLGIVMGTMVEQAFVTSLIKSDGSILPFFERPIAAILAAMAIGALIANTGLVRPSFEPGIRTASRRVLRIGGLRMRVDLRDQRCVMVTIDPVTLHRDPAILRAIARERDNRLGVYGSTVEPGRVAVGDPVELEP